MDTRMIVDRTRVPTIQSQFRHTENSVASNVFVLDRIGE